MRAEKKCGHLGGKVLIPTSQAIRNLNAARLASDVAAPILLLSLALTPSLRANLSNISDIDKPFIKRVAQGTTAGSIQCRTQEGFYQLQEGRGLEFGCVRGQAYAEYADLVWCETSTPDLKDASVSLTQSKVQFQTRCSRTTVHRHSTAQVNPRRSRTKEFQRELGRMGFKFQFITLAGFHQTNYAVFDFANRYKDEGMYAYSLLQEESSMQKSEDTPEKHQREVESSTLTRLRQLWVLLRPQRWRVQPKKTSSKAAPPNKCIWDLENEG